LQGGINGDQQKVVGVEAQIDLLRAAEGSQEQAADN
jgi:hypothetical protein